MKVKYDISTSYHYICKDVIDTLISTTIAWKDFITRSTHFSLFVTLPAKIYLKRKSCIDNDNTTAKVRVFHLCSLATKPVWLIS